MSVQRLEATRRPKKSCKFTPIELIAVVVIVIVIVGVLAAIAVPKYVAMQREARTAALEAMSGALWSAATITLPALTMQTTGC